MFKLEMNTPIKMKRLQKWRLKMKVVILSKWRCWYENAQIKNEDVSSLPWSNGESTFSFLEFSVINSVVLLQHKLDREYEIFCCFFLFLELTWIQYFLKNSINLVLIKPKRPKQFCHASSFSQNTITPIPSPSLHAPVVLWFLYFLMTW